MKKLLVVLIVLALPLSARADTKISTLGAGASAVKVLDAHAERYGVTVQAGSGESANCGSNSSLSSPSFSATNTDTAIPGDGTGEVWCRAGAAATLTFTFSVQPNRPFVVNTDCSTGSAVNMLVAGQTRGASRLTFVNGAATVVVVCPSAAACTAATGVAIQNVIGADRIVSTSVSGSEWACAATGSASVSILVD
jgi:hypothetical protein